MEPVEPILKNIYQGNPYRKDLTWPHFDDEPRVQEKDQQSCIFGFVLCLTIPMATRGTSSDETSVFHIWAFGRFIEIQSILQEKETS